MTDPTPESIDEWRKTMNQYKESKTKLPWGKTQPVSYISEKMKKDIDARYDPILQRYKDPSVEANIKVREHDDMITTLAKNKVGFITN